MAEIFSFPIKVRFSCSIPFCRYISSELTVRSFRVVVPHVLLEFVVTSRFG